MFKGKATAKNAQTFLNKRGLHANQVRNFLGIPVSSLAIGTYLGPMDEITDHKVTQACLRAFDLGCNFIDTAINYRGQRAEKSVAEALRRGLLSEKIKREDIFISSKAGFVPYPLHAVQNLKTFFEQEYVNKGIARKSDLIAECHCIEPKFLKDQLEKSRHNLQCETIDLYYIHNPETQLEEIPARILYDKLEDAFIAMEESVKEGKISQYGVATWNGFRETTDGQLHLSLKKLCEIALVAAKKAGSKKSHFKAVQVPFNLAMPEAALLPTQESEKSSKATTLFQAAEEFGIDIAVSAPLFQSRLCHELPDFILQAFPEDFSQAHCALAFATSFPQVKSAMLGMKTPEHVTHNLEFCKRPKLTKAQLDKVVAAIYS